MPLTFQEFLTKESSIDLLGLKVYNTLMRQIPLSQGKVTLVDDEDFECLNQYKWTYMKGYATRGIGGRKNHKTLYMHREIMHTPKELFTDHIDHDSLNNQKNNLRIVNKKQNMWNSKLSLTNTSGVKGVRKVTHKYKDTRYIYWLAEITVNGKHLRLGKRKEKVEAIKLRKNAEIKYFGEYRNGY